MGSRGKESVIMLLDTSPTMHAYLDAAVRAVQRLIQQKMFSSPKDEVGLVLFGADETDNELAEDPGGYDNIVVARPLLLPDTELVQMLEHVPPGHNAADFGDAIIVGMDMIIKKLGPKKTGNKRLYLITDVESAIKDPEQLREVATQMQNIGLKLDCLLLSFHKPTHSRVTNELLLRDINRTVTGDIYTPSSPEALLGSVKARTVSPTTIYRGTLEINKSLKVKVWVYKKTSELKLPTLKKYSDKAPASDESATRTVSYETEYRSTQDPDQVIPPEQRIKAYRYGPQLIPVSTFEESSLKYTSEKGVRLIGFTKREKVPRHHYLKDTSLFVPEPGNQKAALAMSALARALQKDDGVAILRCVWRQGQAGVVLGVATPHLAEDENQMDCLLFNILPFAEDVREFQFASFSERPAAQVPSDADVEAAENLVKALNLEQGPQAEVLHPETTLNPAIQRFTDFIHARALDPAAPVPPLEASAKLVTGENREHLKQAEWAFHIFKDRLPFTANAPKEKAGRRFWKDRFNESEAGEGGGEENGVKDEPEGRISLEDLAARQVEDVGSLNPVEDFNAMMARTDKPELVPKAISGMKKVVDDLLLTAYAQNTYDKAIVCLRALRTGCIIQEEPLEFNNFLHELAGRCQGKKQDDFWQRLVTERLTLITKAEAADSEATADDAADFLAPKKGKEASQQAEAPNEEENLEDLLEDAF